MFFGLLAHAYRFDAYDQSQQIQAAMVPHMDKDEAEKIIDYYSNASNDILENMEDLTDSGDYSAIDKLKNMLS